MKTIAIIGASYLQRPLVEKAKEMGLRTICFAWEKDAVCQDIADAFYPISIIEKEQILSICRQEHIDGICTIASDVAAPTVAYVAEAMRLTGNSYESALKANNKYLMRQAFAKANVLSPMFYCLTEGETIDCLPHFSFPLIVKPSDRSGSLAVTKVNNEVELTHAITQAQAVSFKHEAMVEEFVEGREISVEFISYHGEHYPLQITDKETTGAPHFIELAHHQPGTLSTEMYQHVYAITKQALNALGITNGASHSEYKIDNEGKIVVIEIGARMGGDFIGSDLVRLSTGYDFLRGVIEVALGEFSLPKITLHNASGIYFLCQSTRRLRSLLEDILQHPEQHPNIVAAELINTELKEPTSSSDRSGYLIYQSKQKLSL